MTENHIQIEVTMTDPSRFPIVGDAFLPAIKKISPKKIAIPEVIRKCEITDSLYIRATKIADKRNTPSNNSNPPMILKISL